MTNPFSLPGQWYKGNLHTHSNQSDGEPSPQQIVDIYAEHAYDFLAITDHNKLTGVSALDSRGLLLIPASELNGGAGELGQHYHVVVLGLDEPVAISAGQSCQEIIDAALALGKVCFIAHPSWSSLTYRDLLNLEGIIGLEVYNTTCHHGIGRGESGTQWDELLARGRRLLGLAVDDAHWHYPDATGGWVMVKAEECSQEGVLAALRQGLFYASNGPTIESIDVGADTLRVICSPAQEIRVICPQAGQGNTSFRLGRPGPYQEAEFRLPDSMHILRVEVVDAAGRTAWSNPMYRE